MNRSSAANMARRKEDTKGLDDYPTPPWATRALMEEVFPQMVLPPVSSIWEPAAGRGHMSKALEPYSLNGVYATDIHDYGVGFPVMDFLTTPTPEGGRLNDSSWVITNPPFRLARRFVAHSLNSIGDNLALLCRLQWSEGLERYRNLFSIYPPRQISVFVERVGMTKGKLDPNVSSATAYAWFVWTAGVPVHTLFNWIPPCREKYTKEGDYDDIQRGLQEGDSPSGGTGEKGTEGDPVPEQGAVPAAEGA